MAAQSCTAVAFAVWAIFRSNQRLWYVLSCLWESAYKKSLAAYQKELPMWQQWVSSYVAMTICLMSNSRQYENQCALEALLNKTNFHTHRDESDLHSKSAAPDLSSPIITKMSNKGRYAIIVLYI